LIGKKESDQSQTFKLQILLTEKYPGLKPRNNHFKYENIRTSTSNFMNYTIH
jgi:hypothetical protein